MILKMEQDSLPSQTVFVPRCNWNPGAHEQVKLPMVFAQFSPHCPLPKLHVQGLSLASHSSMSREQERET